MINDNPDLTLLNENLSACSERIKSLIFSYRKNKDLFPIEVDEIKLLTDEQKESIDAFILRYSQCVSIIQDKIFRGIILVEQEDIIGKSNRDKTVLMEKLGAINSADEFGAAAVLRNKFAHHYPDSSQEQIDKLNILTDETELIVEVFDSLIKYAESKDFLPADSDFGGNMINLNKLELKPN